MRKSLLIVLCCAAFACQPKVEQNTVTTHRVTTTNTPADARNARIDTIIQPIVFVDKSMLGTKLGTDGNVAEESTVVDIGKPVYLTMFLHESPVGLKTQVLWMDAAKKEIKREERDMKGAKIVTFALDTKSLKPGRYHVSGLWGGNAAAEKDFSIESAKESKAKK